MVLKVMGQSRALSPRGASLQTEIHPFCLYATSVNKCLVGISQDLGGEPDSGQKGVSLEKLEAPFMFLGSEIF